MARARVTLQAVKPIEQSRQHSRGFELYMQLGFVSDVLILAAMGNPIAKAVVGEIPDSSLSDVFDRASDEYSELDRISRVRRQLRRRARQ